MNSKLLVTAVLTFLAATAAQATPFNGYIVKVKKGSNFLSSKAVSNYGHVTKIAPTSFGTFGRLETNKGLSDKAMQTLANNPEIEYIEPNYIITINSDKASPMDAMFGKQWGMTNTGKNGGIFSPGVAGEDINVAKAWDITKGATGDNTVRIAVIDTGVDYNHPDLKGQMDVNLAELNGKPGVDDDGDGFIDDIYGYDFANKDGDPADGHGHGTHCAGVIGASHNSIGVAGVMANVKIVAIKFLSDAGSGETIDAISAIDYGIKRKVQVMSNSWGGGEKEQSLLDAITAAEQAGIVFVAAAGNESSNNDSTASYPANYDVSNVISVGAFTSQGAKSSFSNYGLKTVHVTAPGSNILSTTKGAYANMSGTSMAAPHVSGVVGLLLSQEPGLTPAQVRERLVRTSTQTAKLKSASMSGGRVDAYRALMNQ
ncbi:MAG: S8 family serine peptidase [Rhizobacter sp.]|nr:S8 family serine peptidase [Bacteriovorax sp.]